MHSNTEGGWIILGIKEKKTADGSVYVVNGVPNPEQMEQDYNHHITFPHKIQCPRLM
jgi:hypothetical protein